MSLLNRLLLSVTVALAIILAGTLTWSVTAARQYLDGQLQSESDNAISALALSLSQPANQDQVTRELLMMALFDTGKFSTVAFTGLQGELLFERRQPPLAHYKGHAPDWFTRLLPLHAPQVQRAVSDGWKQVGQLSLMVNNAYASDALWRSSTRMALLIVAAGLAWALFVAGLVRWFRRVLRQQIEAQVVAIGKQAADPAAHAPMEGTAPGVEELASVVRAIHATRERVRATAREQDQRIETLQLELNSDPVTGLANRRYLLNELRRVLAAPSMDATAAGHLMLFRQRDLPAVNAHLGHAGTDAWLATVGRHARAVMADASASAPGVQVARLNGSDFIVLIPRLDGPQAALLVQRMRQALEGLRVTLADGRRCRWAYALTDYLAGTAMSEVLTRLDQALMRAESAGHGEVEVIAQDSAALHVAPQDQWRQVLEHALATPGVLALQLHPLSFEDPSRARWQEATLTLRTQGGVLLTGGLFLPAAVRLGLSAAFDVQALELGLQWLAQHGGDTLVVRASLPSLAQPDFREQVHAALQAAPGDAASRLVLELDAHALQADPEDIAEFARQVTDGGTGMALRRLDQSPMALAQLHELALRYVKLGGDFAEQALTSPGGRRLLLAMLATARDLQIPALVHAPVGPQIAMLLREHGASLLTDAP